MSILSRYTILYMKNHYLYILLCLSFYSIVSFSQGYSNFHFKKLQVDNGLSANFVFCIMQDTKGFMWFGTKDGLNKFDGNSCKVFRYNPQKEKTIGNNIIHCMIEADNNKLYVGTEAGLYIMDIADETFEKVENTTADNFKITYTVTTIFKDNRGNIWIGTNSQGIYTYNPEKNELKRVRVNGYDFDSNIVWSIYGDASDNIWVGTRLGLLRYNSNTGFFDPVEGLYSLYDSSEHETQTIVEDVNGDLWLGTWGKGLRLYKKQSNVYTTFLGSNKEPSAVTRIMAICQYRDNALLVGSDNGLYMFDIENRTSKRIDIPNSYHSLSDQAIGSIYKDREGGIWIGTYSGGVNYLSPSASCIETYYSDILSGSLSGKTVRQFCEDENENLWIATENGGVNYFNTKEQTITQPIKGLYHNAHALLLDGDNLWIGTYARGIHVYNTKTKSLSVFKRSLDGKNSINDDGIYALYKTKKGDIYVGTHAGLNKYDRDKNIFINIEQASKFIYDIKEDDFGNLWLATYGSGVIRYHMPTNEWICYDSIYTNCKPLKESKLTNIYIDSKKRLLFASEGQGVFIYDYKTDSFKNISETDGLPNGVIYGILDDPQGNWWMSSNKGIIQMNTSDPHNIKLYTRDDGLQSNQFNYKSSYKALNGKFYFGGINGFSSFYPQDLNKNKNTVLPSIEITQIDILGNRDRELNEAIQQKLNKQQKIVLPYNKSSFSISYTSLSYIAHSKNKYAYKLERTDTEWNYVGNKQSVTYVNLSPGKYLFRVKGSNNDELWNEEGAKVEIEILPPFWLSIPAKIIYVVLILVMAYLIISFYIKKSRAKQEKQLEAFKTEQENLAFKSKIDFFTTIAHEIRTPLSLISAPLEEVVNSGEGSPETKENILIIEKNCDRLTDLINQLLDFRKMDSTQYIINPTRVDLRHLLTELYGRISKTAQKQHIDFTLQLPQNELVVNSDTDALIKIIGNLLTNALKYTKDKIALSLIKNENATYSVFVEDNGNGVSDAYKKLIFDPFYQVQNDNGKMGTGLGLSLAKKLAEMLNGNITVKDNETGEATFVFNFSDLPLLYQHKSELDNIASEKEIIKNRSTPENKNSILIVEDNIEMASFIKNSLNKDYVADTAFNAEEAILLLEENSYDIIISDIMMPGIDGISFTKKLKSDLNYNHIPIILLSAKTENAVKIEGLHSGADVFIEKPFSVSYLKAQIISLLENRRTVLEAFNRSPFISYSALVTSKNDELFLNQLNEEIERHISDENFSVESLTDIFNISRSHLQRKLKAIAGATPGDYLRNYRLRKACQLLLETDMRVNEVAYSVGFSTASYFTRVFQKAYGILPKEFIAQHANKAKK